MDKKIQINPDKLQAELRKFKAYLKYETGIPLNDFRSHPFIYQQEGYKYDVHRAGFDELSYIDWNTKDIGKGKILDAVIASIEIKGSNLVTWDERRGPNKREHLKILELRKDKSELKIFEKNTYDFFYNICNPEFYFNFLAGLTGNKYRVIAYLFFLKNSEKYLPISQKRFDELFLDLNIPLVTTRNCSWQNYCEFLQIISEVRYFLSAELNCDITLLDAHSFCWILTSQMRNSEGFLKVKGFSLPANEKSRDIVTKSRIGQGPYRTNLLSKWSGRSSLSNYSNENFLIASHIKPWKDCDNDEAVDPDNGLLLIPSHDAAFDKGHISFDNDGLIIISSKLDSNDLEVLGLSNKLKIRKVTSRLQKYLEYHRKNIFNG